MSLLNIYRVSFNLVTWMLLTIVCILWSRERKKRSLAFCDQCPYKFSLTYFLNVLVWPEVRFCQVLIPFCLLPWVLSLSYRQASLYSSLLFCIISSSCYWCSPLLITLNTELFQALHPSLRPSDGTGNPNSSFESFCHLSRYFRE